MEQMKSPEKKPENPVSRMAKRLAMALGLMVAAERGAQADEVKKQETELTALKEKHPETGEFLSAVEKTTKDIVEGDSQRDIQVAKK